MLSQRAEPESPKRQQNWDNFRWTLCGLELSLTNAEAISLVVLLELSGFACSRQGLINKNYSSFPILIASNNLTKLATPIHCCQF